MPAKKQTRNAAKKLDNYGTTNIARLIKVSNITVQHWIDAGEMPCYRTLGGHRRVRRADLFRFLKRKGLPVPAVGLSRKLDIMILDDDRGTLNVYESLILDSFTNVNVYGFDSWTEALLKVGQLQPNLLLLDLTIPKLDCVDVITRIKAGFNFSGINIIAYSGKPKKGRKALEQGAVAFYKTGTEITAVVHALPEYLPELRRRVKRKKARQNKKFTLMG